MVHSEGLPLPRISPRFYSLGTDDFWDNSFLSESRKRLLTVLLQYYVIDILRIIWSFVLILLVRWNKWIAIFSLLTILHMHNIIVICYKQSANPMMINPRVNSRNEKNMEWIRQRRRDEIVSAVAILRNSFSSTQCQVYLGVTCLSMSRRLFSISMVHVYT